MNYYYIYKFDDNIQKYLETNKDKKNKLLNEEIIFTTVKSSIKDYHYNNQSITTFKISSNEYHKKSTVKIRIKSKFFFISATTEGQKNEVIENLIKFFEKIGNVENFIPSPKKEKKLICDAEEKELKFFYENDIVHNEKIANDYCQNGIINKKYSLFEAELIFKDNNSLLYYRDAINIESDNEEFIIQKFENIMGDG
ncbi:hypothetical protein [Methanobrevibacter sp. DSM 116169]|uniref:hypothetical protein n=1 Tax=Methanobrevibacter sp. DSM 116169 TaxID=3242727 RepID=UPI0038FC15A2